MDPTTKPARTRGRRLSDLKLTRKAVLPRRNTTAAIPKSTPNLKTQRTSKTSQKLVLLPSEPQNERPLSDEELTHGYETDRGVKELKSEAEKMTKEQRKEVRFHFLSNTRGQMVARTPLRSQVLDM